MFVSGLLIGATWHTSNSIDFVEIQSKFNLQSSIFNLQTSVLKLQASIKSPNFNHLLHIYLIESNRIQITSMALLYAHFWLATWNLFLSIQSRFLNILLHFHYLHWQDEEAGKAKEKVDGLHHYSDNFTIALHGADFAQHLCFTPLEIFKTIHNHNQFLFVTLITNRNKIPIKLNTTSVQFNTVQSCLQSYYQMTNNNPSIDHMKYPHSRNKIIFYQNSRFKLYHFDTWHINWHLHGVYLQHNRGNDCDHLDHNVLIILIIPATLLWKILTELAFRT